MVVPLANVCAMNIGYDIRYFWYLREGGPQPEVRDEDYEETIDGRTWEDT